MRYAEPVARSGRGVRRGVDYPRVGLIALGHLVSDMYSNLLTALTPYLVLEGKVSAAVAGLILLVYLGGSSVLQPLFGLWADRSGRRMFAVFGPLWVGTAACLTGLAPNAGVIFLLAVLAGVGAAAFHPQAATMVNRITTGRKAWSLAIFSMGGNIGFALGPVLAAGFALAGLVWTPVAIIPGIVLAALLVRFAPRLPPEEGSANARDLLALGRAAWFPLSLVVSVIAIRSAVQYALIFFLPLYFHAHGSSAELGSVYAFVLSLAGAVGGLPGGHLADRHGRKLVVVASLLLASPLIFLVLHVQAALAWPVLAAAGATLLASNSVTVVQGQELLPGNTGVASGLTLGLAFGLSGVLASILAALSGPLGLTTSVNVVAALPLIAAACAFAMPNRGAARTGAAA